MRGREELERRLQHALADAIGRLGPIDSEQAAAAARQVAGQLISDDVPLPLDLRGFRLELDADEVADLRAQLGASASPSRGREWLTARQFAETVGLSVNTVYERAASLGGVKLHDGPRAPWRFPSDAVEDFGQGARESVLRPKGRTQESRRKTSRRPAPTGLQVRGVKPG